MSDGDWYAGSGMTAEQGRPRSPGLAVERRYVVARGLVFTFTTDQLPRPDRHVVYVYLGGAEHLTPGDIWWRPAGSSGEALFLGDAVRHCEIAIPVRTLADVAPLPRAKFRDLLVHHLVEELCRLGDRDDETARLLTDSIAESLLQVIKAKCTQAPLVPRERRILDAPTRKAVVEYLDVSLGSRIRLDSLAGLAGMSVPAFISAFRQSFHATPYQYLLDRRIERAQTLLLTPSRSIAEIAESVGFTTPGHFATAFKRRVGISPSAYRRSH